MATAGYSGTSLQRKLGIKTDHMVAVIGDPGHAGQLLAELPEGVVLRLGPRGAGSFDVVMAFVPNRGQLVKRFDRGRALLDPYGGLWIVWPKQTSTIATSMRESDVREYGLSTGLVDNKICAVDEDWSALRFVVRTENRPPKKKR